MENWNLLQIRLTVCLLREPENVKTLWMSITQRRVDSCHHQVHCQMIFPASSSPFSPVNDLGILSVTTKNQQLASR